jgi:hypothetical protein
MTRARFIAPAVLAGILVGGWFLFTLRRDAVSVPSVDDLVKQSARELVDPTGTNLRTLEQGTDSASLRADEAEFACADGKSGDYACYENYYRTLVKKHGVAYAFADLKRRYPQSGYVQAQCHPFTHVIGRAGANVYGSVGEAFTHGDGFCWSGYYHGVMEAVVGKYSPETLGAAMDGICANVPGRAAYNFDYYNCVHGLGHGVMVVTKTELFDSLALCDRLTGEWERSSCAGGVFMENVMVDNRNHFTKYLKPDEPLYPCTAVDERHKTQCYLMQTSYILKVNGGNFAPVFTACRGAEPAFQPTCFQSVGRDASGQSVSDAARTRATCELGQNYEERSNCIIGAVKDFISYFHSDVQAKELCDSLAEDLRDVCRSTAENYYRSFAKT